MQCAVAFNAPRSRSFWRGLMTRHLVMTVARAMQAFVENIPWHDTRLAHDSFAGVVCPMETVKT
jgi:hypothetical protein